MEREPILEDPEVADVATWGVIDPPRYIDDLPDAEKAAAVARVEKRREQAREAGMEE